MKVSVVICVYSMDRYKSFIEAVESVLAQTYDPIEVVLVIDGNEDMYDRIEEQFGKRADTVIHCNEENRGLSYSRTKGVELSSGEAVAFLDDDAIAKPDWIETLVFAYEQTDAIAVGGKMVPEWVAGKSSFLPEEFYWLVGANYEERLEPWSEVRNTLGSNMSFRREVFDKIGGFNEGVGLTADDQIQAEETEFAMRMYDTFAKGMLYVPDAIVAHKIFEYRTKPMWLCKRAFWQGYSKRAIEELNSDEPSNEEAAFLRHLADSAVPKRIRGIICDPSIKKIQQLVMLVVLTACVGLGYVYGVVRSFESCDYHIPNFLIKLFDK
ncbi:glucosyl-dolichyl phosphate glucuronosyltransferase [Halonotius pteroides]|uniref:Glycosyltransferase family 2 protein n=1 Tax=Halonotius pteroides TaxID=268735 RepID=A0A3A6Q2M9_9EURY|nr:glucosyl-dolichyl phosphate glucuronosyltransferase [Halonotius pteroides]RJX49973.1 glycosyltransferase family 2 protein [Halonotius pteroides]